MELFCLILKEQDSLGDLKHVHKFVIFLHRCVCFDDGGKVVEVVDINNNEQNYIYEKVKNRLNLENACYPAQISWLFFFYLKM
jgi:hypothetical protein